MLGAQLYDLLCKDLSFDIDIYLRGLLKNAHILELGIGTGRTIKKPLQLGHHCTGIDIDPDMLAFCRAEPMLQKLSLYQSDMSDFSIPHTFDQIQLPLRTLQLLPPQKQRSCIQCAVQHLKPKGRILIHISSWKKEHHTGLWHLHRILPTVDGGKMFIEESSLATHSTLELCYKMYHTSKHQQVVANYIVHRSLYCITPQELSQMFASHNLSCAIFHQNSQSECFFVGEAP